MLGISNRPLKSRDPGGSGSPLSRTQRTLALRGPSSRHWNTTSRPILHIHIVQKLQILIKKKKKI